MCFYRSLNVENNKAGKCTASSCWDGRANLTIDTPKNLESFPPTEPGHGLNASPIILSRTDVHVIQF